MRRLVPFLSGLSSNHEVVINFPRPPPGFSATQIHSSLALTHIVADSSSYSKSPGLVFLYV